MKIYDMKQGSEDWYKIKKLHFTASHANTIIANGKGLSTLVDEMLCDYYSSGTFEEYSNKYKNSQMQRGNDYEDKARKIYELETGKKVQQVGFIELDNRIGCSPDGLVGEDGLIEIKNHSDIVFFRLMKERVIDKKYLDQMQFQMFVTGRKWCDYFAFNPNFSPCFIKIRVKKDLDTFQKIMEGIRTGRELLETRKQNLDGLFSVEESLCMK